MTPRPIGNRVFLKVEAQAEEKRRSIWIPDRARSKPQEGLVVAVGPLVATVKVGDRVLFGKFSVLEMGEYGLVLREPDLIAVLEA